MSLEEFLKQRIADLKELKEDNPTPSKKWWLTQQIELNIEMLKALAVRGE